MSINQAPNIDHHAVHFYETDEDLASVVAAFMCDELARGGAAVLVVTAEHLPVFEAALQRNGVDTAAASRDERLIVRDAATTLDALMVGGEPNAGAFEREIGSLLRPLTSASAVRVFGEMVGLLWEAGAVAQAIALEAFWDDLCRELSLPLLCAYPSDDRVTVELDAYAAVCAGHASLLGGAPRPVGVEAFRCFPASLQAPGAARRFVTALLLEWGLGHLAEAAVLAVSELVTNAILHTGSDTSIGVARRGDAVRIVVGDSSPVPPAPRQPSEAPGGHGLHIVAAIVDEWGHDLVEGGKVVWADVGVRQHAEAECRDEPGAAALRS